MKFKNLFIKIPPIIFILAVIIVLFFPFFRKGLLPIPADIIVGVYYPWLDYKWGYSVGVPVKNPLLADVPSILYPWRSLVIDELKHFRWPLWNPYYFGGMPLLANFQSAVFSYSNIFFLFLPKAIAWSVGVIASPLLTILAVYFFLRNRKLSQISSLFGAVVFGLSGFEIAWLEYNVHGHTTLFFPLLLLAIDKFMKGKKKFWLFILPIFVAFQIFSGYIPVVIYSTVVCGIYILFFYLIPQIKQKKVEWSNYFILAFFWILGFCLSAIQLFPGYELTKNSIRAVDPIVEASNASYLPLKNMATFLAPDFFGSPVTGNYFGVAFYDNFYLFVGTGTLILVVYSLFFFKRIKDIQFWLLILIISFILFLKNPIGLFLEKILFLSGGVAAKAIFLSDFSLAILAAFGLELFLEKKSYWKRKRKEIISVTVIGIFLAVTVAFSFLIKVPANRLTAQRNLIIPIGVYFLTSLMVIVGVTIEKTKIKVVGLALLFLTTGQLLYSAKKYLPFSKEETLFPLTPVIEFLQNKKEEGNNPFRVELGNVIPQNFLMPYGIETTSGYDTLLPKRTGEFLSLVENGQIQKRISRVRLITQYDSPLFPLLGTKYILAKKINSNGIYTPDGNPPDEFNNQRYKLTLEDKTVVVYEDSRYLPRAFLTHSYKYFSNLQDYLNYLPLADYKNEVVLEEVPKNFVNIETGDDKDKVEWLENLPGKKVFIIEASSPGFVFLSNNYYPGWRASINSVPTKIYRANYTFQSIQTGPGKHLIVFEYFPKSFHLGSLISLFTLLNWLLFSFVFIIKNFWGRKIEKSF